MSMARYEVPDKIHLIQGKIQSVLIFSHVGRFLSVDNNLLPIILRLQNGPIETGDPFEIGVFESLRKLGLFNKVIQSGPEIFLKPSPYLIILPTAKCPLQCIYCSSNSSANGRTLSFPQIQPAIDEMIEAADSGAGKAYLTVTGGGEPLMAIDLLQHMLDYAEQKAASAKVELKPYLVTSGICDIPKILFARARFARITISADGPALVQNFQRPLASGRPSFEIVEKSLNLLDENFSNYDVRVTITPDSADRLPAIFEHYAEKHRPFAVNFAPVTNTGRAKNQNWQAFDVETFVGGAMTVAKMSRKTGVGASIAEIPIPAVFQLADPGYASEAPSLFFGLRQAKVITPEGWISMVPEVCSSDDPLQNLCNIGEIRDRKTYINKTRLRKLIDFLKINRCIECPINHGCDAINKLSCAMGNPGIKCQIVEPLLQSSFTQPWLDRKEIRHLEPVHVKKNCLLCGYCESICPTHAIAMLSSGPMRNSSLCDYCFRCVRLCPKRCWMLKLKSAN